MKDTSVDFAQQRDADLKRDKARLFVYECLRALRAQRQGRLSDFASIMGYSRKRARAYALVAEHISRHDVWPDMPIDTILACAEADGCTHPDYGPLDITNWYDLAGSFGWSARAVRDFADIAKGRHVSRVPVAKGRHPYRRHGDELHITVPDMTGIEDGAGGVADVAVYPVLEKGE